MSLKGKGCWAAVLDYLSRCALEFQQHTHDVCLACGDMHTADAPAQASVDSGHQAGLVC